MMMHPTLAVIACACLPLLCWAQSHEEYIQSRQPRVTPGPQQEVDPLRFAAIGWTPQQGPARPDDVRAGNRALRDAVAAADLEGLQKILETTPSAARDSVALMRSIDDGCVACARLLLAAGADPNLRSPRRPRPLHHAIALGREEIAVLLIDAGAFVDARGPRRVTPLIEAARFNRARVARRLMTAGADALRADHLGRPPVVLAAELGHIEVLEALLASGADADAVDKDGRPALYWAVYRKRRDAIRMLLSYGARRGTIAVDLY